MGSLEKWWVHFGRWVAIVAARCSRGYYDSDDIRQECYIQLWRCLERQPAVPEEEFEAFYKRCVMNRLCNLVFTPKRNAVKMASLDYEIDLTYEAHAENGASWYHDRLKDLMELCEDPELQPWIQKGLREEKAFQGMRRHVYTRIKDLASDCLT